MAGDQRLDQPPARRPDASMDLLNNLRATALDPAYRDAANAHGGQRRRLPVLLPALVLVGLLFGIAVGGTWRTAPVAAQERAALIGRITGTETRLDALRAQAAALDREVRDLGRTSGVLTDREEDLALRLGSGVGADAVAGPGVRVTLDDGADATVEGSRVVDTDLRMVANGLWAAGAEAVAINGHRLSVRTATRNAGDAITVDYRSLTRPYVIEAIGEPRALEEGFRASPGGEWVRGLAEHYGVRWALAHADPLTLPGDPGLGVDRAVRAR